MTSHWKRVERTVAQRMGGQRVPVSGRTRGDVPDVRCHDDGPVVEVKSRNRLPDWLLTALAQAKASARAEQLPLVRLHENGARYSTDVICVLASDWEQWYGPLPIAEGDDDADDNKEEQ